MDATTIVSIAGCLLIGIALAISIWKHDRD